MESNIYTLSIPPHMTQQEFIELCRELGIDTVIDADYYPTVTLREGDDPKNIFGIDKKAFNKKIISELLSNNGISYDHRPNASFRISSKPTSYEQAVCTNGYVDPVKAEKSSKVLNEVGRISRLVSAGKKILIISRSNEHKSYPTRTQVAEAIERINPSFKGKIGNIVIARDGTYTVEPTYERVKALLSPYYDVTEENYLDYYLLTRKGEERDSKDKFVSFDITKHDLLTGFNGEKVTFLKKPNYGNPVTSTNVATPNKGNGRYTHYDRQILESIQQANAKGGGTVVLCADVNRSSTTTRTVTRYISEYNRQVKADEQIPTVYVRLPRSKDELDNYDFSRVVNGRLRKVLHRLHMKGKDSITFVFAGANEAAFEAENRERQRDAEYINFGQGDMERKTGLHFNEGLDEKLNVTDLSSADLDLFMKKLISSMMGVDVNVAAGISPDGETVLAKDLISGCVVPGETGVATSAALVFQERGLSVNIHFGHDNEITISYGDGTDPNGLHVKGDSGKAYILNQFNQGLSHQTKEDVIETAMEQVGNMRSRDNERMAGETPGLSEVMILALQNTRRVATREKPVFLADRLIRNFVVNVERQGIIITSADELVDALRTLEDDRSGELVIPPFISSEIDLDMIQKSMEMAERDIEINVQDGWYPVAYSSPHYPEKRREIQRLATDGLLGEKIMDGVDISKMDDVDMEHMKDMLIATSTAAECPAFWVKGQVENLDTDGVAIVPELNEKGELNTKEVLRSLSSTAIAGRSVEGAPIHLKLDTLSREERKALFNNGDFLVNNFTEIIRQANHLYSRKALSEMREHLSFIKGRMNGKLPLEKSINVSLTAKDFGLLDQIQSTLVEIWEIGEKKDKNDLKFKKENDILMDLKEDLDNYESRIRELQGAIDSNEAELKGVQLQITESADKDILKDLGRREAELIKDNEKAQKRIVNLSERRDAKALSVESQEEKCAVLLAKDADYEKEIASLQEKHRGLMKELSVFGLVRNYYSSMSYMENRINDVADQIKSLFENPERYDFTKMESINDEIELLGEDYNNTIRETINNIHNMNMYDLTPDNGIHLKFAYVEKKSKGKKKAGEEETKKELHIFLPKNIASEDFMKLYPGEYFLHDLASEWEESQYIDPQDMYIFEGKLLSEKDYNEARESVLDEFKYSKAIDNKKNNLLSKLRNNCQQAATLAVAKHAMKYPDDKSDAILLSDSEVKEFNDLVNIRVIPEVKELIKDPAFSTFGEILTSLNEAANNILHRADGYNVLYERSEELELALRYNGRVVAYVDQATVAGEPEKQADEIILKGGTLVCESNPLNDVNNVRDLMVKDYMAPAFEPDLDENNMPVKQKVFTSFEDMAKVLSVENDNPDRKKERELENIAIAKRDKKNARSMNAIQNTGDIVNAMTNNIEGFDFWGALLRLGTSAAGLTIPQVFKQKPSDENNLIDGNYDLTVIKQPEVRNINDPTIPDIIVPPANVAIDALRENIKKQYGHENFILVKPGSDSDKYIEARKNGWTVQSDGTILQGETGDKHTVGSLLEDPTVIKVHYDGTGLVPITRIEDKYHTLFFEALKDAVSKEDDAFRKELGIENMQKIYFPNAVYPVVSDDKIEMYYGDEVVLSIKLGENGLISIENSDPFTLTHSSDHVVTWRNILDENGILKLDKSQSPQDVVAQNQPIFARIVGNIHDRLFYETVNGIKADMDESERESMRQMHSEVKYANGKPKDLTLSNIEMAEEDLNQAYMQRYDSQQHNAQEKEDYREFQMQEQKDFFSTKRQSNREAILLGYLYFHLQNANTANERLQKVKNFRDMELNPKIKEQIEAFVAYVNKEKENVANEVLRMKIGSILHYLTASPRDMGVVKSEMRSAIAIISESTGSSAAKDKECITRIESALKKVTELTDQYRDCTKNITDNRLIMEDELGKVKKLQAILDDKDRDKNGVLKTIFNEDEKPITIRYGKSEVTFDASKQVCNAQVKHVAETLSHFYDEHPELNDAKTLSKFYSDIVGKIMKGECKEARIDEKEGLCVNYNGEYYSLYAKTSEELYVKALREAMTDITIVKRNADEISLFQKDNAITPQEFDNPSVSDKEMVEYMSLYGKYQKEGTNMLESMRQEAQARSPQKVQSEDIIAELKETRKDGETLSYGHLAKTDDGFVIVNDNGYVVFPEVFSDYEMNEDGEVNIIDGTIYVTRADGANNYIDLRNLSCKSEWITEFLYDDKHEISDDVAVVRFADNTMGVLNINTGDCVFAKNCKDLIPLKGNSFLAYNKGFSKDLLDSQGKSLIRAFLKENNLWCRDIKDMDEFGCYTLELVDKETQKKEQYHYDATQPGKILTHEEFVELKNGYGGRDSESLSSPSGRRLSRSVTE